MELFHRSQAPFVALVRRPNFTNQKADGILCAPESLEEVEVYPSDYIKSCITTSEIFSTAGNVISVTRGINSYYGKVSSGSNGKLYFPKKGGRFYGNQYVKNVTPLKSMRHMGAFSRIFSTAEDYASFKAAYAEDQGVIGPNCQRLFARIAGREIGSKITASVLEAAGAEIGFGVASVPLSIAGGVIGDIYGGQAGEEVGEFIFDCLH